MERFSLHRSQPDGRQRRCKDCVRQNYVQNASKVRAQVNAYRAANAEAVKARKREYRQKYPDRVRAQSRHAYEARRDYYAGRARASYAANAESRSAAARQWVEANRAAVRAIKSRYKHKRRALESGTTFDVSVRDLERLLRQHGFACAYCRATFGLTVPLTWDHVVPVARGGAYSIGNLAPACGPCNSSKGKKTLTEWRARRRRLGMRELACFAVL